MPRALEVVAGFATNPGATFTALTASTGTSFTVRGTDATKPAWMLSSWAFNASAGELRIRSTKLHDFQQGIRNRVSAALTAPLTPGHTNGSFAQRLYSQDALTVEITGGAAELDCGALLIGYDDLQGIAGRFIDQPTLKKNGQNIVTSEVTVTAVATGNFGGAVAINSTFDTLIANTDYAILGAMTDTRGCAIGITGVDLGNLRVGVPCEPTLRDETQNWFEQLSVAFNAPYIPVINSANKNGITIDVQTNGAGGTFTINIIMVQLAPGAVPPSSTGAATAGAAQPGA
jgi:hypothetical protein